MKIQVLKIIVLITATLGFLVLPAMVPADAQTPTGGRKDDRGAQPAPAVSPASQGAAIGPGRGVDIDPAPWERAVERANDRMMRLSGADAYAKGSAAERRRALRGPKLYRERHR